MTRIVHIAAPMPRHGAHSGYARLSEAMSARVIAPPRLANRLLDAMPARLPRLFLDPPNSGWYWNNSFLAAELAALATKAVKSCIIHALYGENSFRWLGFGPQKRPGALVATLHQPQSVFFTAMPQPKLLERADALIALAPCQMDFLEKLCPKTRIFFVPHGVDTHFFRPLENVASKEPFTALVVGSWLRDEALLNSTIQKCSGMDTPIRFLILAEDSFKKGLEQNAHVKVLGRVSDSGLLDLYRSANCLLLPLKDAVASNALLEGMACGLPIAATDVGGVSAYTNADCALLAPAGNARRLADILEFLAQNPQACSEMGRQARLQALSHSWSAIAQKMRSVYSAIIQ
ncbi:MAG: glycosyltransferase family 4 protein [Desulfatibacillaceae bacterium]|nr:glycosyltransferase family 4 protein [Desulfatibacillaceae bacterium]